MATAIGALILASLGEALDRSVQAQTANRGANDLSQQARFAMQRIESAIRLAPASATLATKASDDTSADWLAASTFLSGGVTYCLRGTQLIEKSPATTACAVASSDRVVADSVSAFSVRRWAPGTALQTRVIDVSLSLASGNQAITLTSRARLGGGTT